MNLFPPFDPEQYKPKKDEVKERQKLKEIYQKLFGEDGTFKLGK